MQHFDPKSDQTPLPSLEVSGAALQVVESRMGDACIASNKLTRAEVDQVLALQAKKQMRFGEAAIALGMLTEHDVRELLNVQFNNASFSSPELVARISPTLAILHAPESDAAQSIKRLRSELLVQMGDERKLVLAVVSPEKGEGKSYIAASLAIAFAQLNIKTLLVDADLREPVQHRWFGLPNQTGLSTALAKRSSGSLEAMTELVPGFWVLGSGPLPPNPLEMLTAPWFRRFVEPLAEQVSVVIVDTPSGAHWADAQMLAGQAGAAIVVARKDVTHLRNFKRFHRDLGFAGVDVLGVVFNQVLDAGRQRSGPWSSERSTWARLANWVSGLFKTGAA